MCNKNGTYKKESLLKIKRRPILAVIFGVTVLMAVAAPAILARFPFAAKAAHTPITIEIDGAAQAFTTTPYIDSLTNISLVPLEEMFAKLQILTSYNPATKAYLGAHARSSILLAEGSDTGYYDSTPIPLGTPTTAVSGTAMLDLGFIRRLYGVTVDESPDRTQVKISTTTPYATFDADDHYRAQVDALSGTDILRQPSAVGANHGSAHFTPSSACANSEVTVAGQPFTEAIQNTASKKDLSNVHTCQLQYKLNDAVNPGDLLIVQFSARVTATDDPYGNAYARFGIAKADGTSSLSLYNDVSTITADWQTFYVPFDTGSLPAALSANDRLHVHTAYGNQTIQLGNVKLIKLPKSVAYQDVEKHFYRGQSSDAVWRKVALERIEQQRKAPINVVVKDAAGNPIHDADVTVEMIKRDFIFGAALNTVDLANDQTYRANIPPFFDLIEPENALKWVTYESDACTGRAGADYFYQYALDNDYLLRGHNLIWDEAQHYPKYEDYNPAAGCTKNSPLDWSTISETDAARIISAHISKVVPKYPELIDWDVWNEPTGSDKRLLRNRFGEQFFAQFFKLVESLSPKAKKYINDFYLTGNHDKGEDELITLIQKLKAAGAKVDGLGAQSHVTGRAYPQDIYNQITNVGQHVDEVSITEYNIRSRDENIGADYLRDMLILAYSNAKVKGFVNWSYRDTADGSRSSLVRRDYTKKPAYFAMEKQLEAWRTNTSGKTDTQGSYSTPAHRGTYRITASFGTSTDVVEYHTADSLPVVELTLRDASLPDCSAAGHSALSAQTFTGDILRVPDDAKTVADINAWTAAHTTGTIVFTADFGLDDTLKVYGTKDITFTSEHQVAILNRGATFAGAMINGNPSSVITIKNVVIDGSSASSPVTGQAVYTTGNLTMEATTIRHNHSSSYGAGVMINGNSKLQMTGTLICGNTVAATRSGGGVRISGGATATISNSYITENTASTGAGISAGESAALTLTNTVVQGNTATDSGGGISLTDSARLDFIDSTIAKNQAKKGVGGGVFVMNNAVLHIASGAMTQNTAGSGGAIYTSSNNVILVGTPIIGETTTDNGIHLSGGATLKVRGDLDAGAKINIEEISSAKHGSVVANKEDASGNPLTALPADAKLFYYMSSATPKLSVIPHKTNYILSEPIYNSLDVAATPLAVAPDKISSAPHAVQVRSNHHDGYILTFSTATTDNALRHATASANIPAISTLAPSTISAKQPAWGYRIDGFGAFGNESTTAATNADSSKLTWAGVPPSLSPTILRTTTTHDPNYTHDVVIYYAVSAPMSLPAGSYSTTVVYTLVPQI
ncbi:MAG: endo-1,4-beta-xylanase [Candidatus Nomurabacteria bacterium]|jgi:GH35 family endo-1,4-beta-xylanase|nr:endo-1,4-beta-xylanase [Candidatus Nomurabacteria bacterium]